MKAQFCNESEVNEKYHNRNWESPCDIKMKAKTDESTFEKKKALASFKKMEIEKFERKPDVQVCEDKFRIVFTTRVKIGDQEILVAVSSTSILDTFNDSLLFSLLSLLKWVLFKQFDLFYMMGVYGECLKKLLIMYHTYQFIRN